MPSNFIFTKLQTFIVNKKPDLLQFSVWHTSVWFFTWQSNHKVDCANTMHNDCTMVFLSKIRLNFLTILSSYDFSCQFNYYVYYSYHLSTTCFQCFSLFSMECLWFFVWRPFCENLLEKNLKLIWWKILFDLMFNCWLFYV